LGCLGELERLDEIAVHMHATDEVINVEYVLLKVHALHDAEDSEATAAEDIPPGDFVGRALDLVGFVELLRSLIAPLLLIRTWFVPHKVCVRDMAIVYRLSEVIPPLIVRLAALRKVLKQRLGFGAENGCCVCNLLLSNPVRELEQFGVCFGPQLFHIHPHHLEG